jgi:hypothetical protein
MTKDELYASVPTILKRLMLIGLPAAGVFLAFWYYGGINIYGHFMDLTLTPFKGIMDLKFRPDQPSHAAFDYRFMYEGEPGQLGFPINLWHLTMIQLVTLLAVWPHKSAGRFIHLLFWSLFFLWAYHVFNMCIQLIDIQYGPRYANQKGVFWEPTLIYQVASKIAAFDKFIGRYWFGFPIFLAALIVESLVFKRFARKAEVGQGKKKKPKG